jgi:hypothetical protein
MLPSGNMGRRKTEGNHSLPRNKVVQDLEQNKKTNTQFQSPTKQT